MIKCFGFRIVVGLWLGGVWAAGVDPVSAAGDDPFENLPLVLEVDPVQTAPTDEAPAGASEVVSVLGRSARVLPPGDEARRMVYRLGAGEELKAGQAYVLEVEYPDDVPRGFFVANRGADLVRGWATGSAVGIPRRQPVEPSLESLAYPQSGQWQVYRQFFVMQERLQGVKARRNPEPGSRPFTPADGFHVVFFQTSRVNDPRSEGLAIGRLRLYAVPDPRSLVAPLNRPPAELPQRRVFWREEMSDQAISASAAEDRAFADPLDWYGAKFQLAWVLGIDTFSKDLLEFGFNQGWESGDQGWVMEAQPPLKDLWTRLVPRAAAAGFTLLPYYEYKGAIGWEGAGRSLGRQRRAEKLYHGIHRTGDPERTDKYTGVWWTEDHNADVTDPDTLEDFLRVLERTLVRFRETAQFAGAWVRTRDNHLPISFSEAAVGRFRLDFPEDIEVAKVSRTALITSYEGDRRLYDRYVSWWLGRRAAFLTEVQRYLAGELGGEPQVLFTPWTTEQIPTRLAPESDYHGVGVVTDDVRWWDAYAKTRTDNWYRWKWVPTAWERVVSEGWWARSLFARPSINDPANWQHQEAFHSAPGADPERYRDRAGIMMTYPFGPLYTVSGPDPIGSFRAESGLTVVHHQPLNENDEGWARKEGDERLVHPFDEVVGYVAADVERAGPHVMLAAARAVAYGDPRNLAYLSAANFCTGFPLEVRRFIQAFVSVPALPSRVLADAASSPKVVVREVPAGRNGNYFFVVNTDWRAQESVRVRIPGAGLATDLVTGDGVEGAELRMDLGPAELRAFRVAAPKLP